MSNKLDDNLRAVFASIADVLIPAAEGMPSATEVGVHEYNALPFCRECNRQVDAGIGFSHATFSTGNGEYTGTV